MDRTERFYRIERLLRARRTVPMSVFLEELGVSRATFKRDVQYLRDRMNAPIEWDREAGGYCFSSAAQVGPQYELPGIWFNSSELYALLVAHDSLSRIDPWVLAPHISPIRHRLLELLRSSGRSPADLLGRIRVLPMTSRTVEPRFFTEIARALFERRRIGIQAYSRARDEVNARVVSPQRLVHYRDNWYLDAWCHWREALRSFSVDSIRGVGEADGKAKEIPEADLDAYFAASYGIFAGKVMDWAVFRFSPHRARWVEQEHWHPDQVCEHLEDGGCRLRVPYSDERELLMDILRHGAEVVVEAPESLRERVKEELGRMGSVYG
ncbi:MAG: YafY family transcriptional regulator, partial [Proteobacteria bacterium]|nr:YafY family transcriptional regulator [Pseudomonadota bacterium]